MPRLSFLLILATVAIVYFAGLHGPLVFDDVQNLGPLNEWLQGRSGWKSVVFGNQSGMFGRPISMASFVANVALLGPEIFSLKLGNLAIHLVNACLVYVLFEALTRRQQVLKNDLTPGQTNWLPWFAASAWTLHPLLSSTILYVVQRMAMLSATFTLLALIGFIYGRSALLDGANRRAILLLAVTVPTCTLLAALSKENGVLAPALCAVAELILFPPAGRQKRSWFSKALIAIALVLPAIGAMILVLTDSHFLQDGYANRTFTLGQRLLTESRVLWDYVGTAVAPHATSMGIYHDDYLVSRSLLNPFTTAFALFGWLSVVCVAWFWRREIPGFSLGIGIFLVGHALESTIFPLLLYFEHRNYLPLVGLIWAVVALVTYCINTLFSGSTFPTRIWAFVAGAVVLALAISTSGRALAWRDSTTLLQTSLVAHPNSRWLRLDLIAYAMQAKPAQVANARMHIDYLLAAEDSDTRRLGAVESVMLDCATTSAVQKSEVERMFEGRAQTIEADAIPVFDALADGIVAHPCNGIAPADMADGLASMLDKAALPDQAVGVWRLRFRAANLYLAANKPDDALTQGKMAYAEGAADPQVAFFVAGLLIEKGDGRDAGIMLNAAARSISNDDTYAQSLVRQYRAKISSLPRY